MPDDNPYAPPSVPAVLFEPEWPEQGAFRDGTFLVIKPGSPLPAICFRTGTKAEETLSFALVCRGDDDRSLIPELQSYWSGTFYGVEIPICSDWMRTGRRYLFQARLALTLGFSLLLPTPFLQAFLLSVDRTFYAWCCLLTALPLLTAGHFLQVAGEAKPLLQRIAREYMWIRGADRRFLEQLPEWPGKRISFWQRV
jgi:hypothetical protein